MTSLDYAVLYGYVDKVKYLVEMAGANICRKDEVIIPFALIIV
jgi:hypothetical protein